MTPENVWNLSFGRFWAYKSCWFSKKYSKLLVPQILLYYLHCNGGKRTYWNINRWHPSNKDFIILFSTRKKLKHVKRITFSKMLVIRDQEWYYDITLDFKTFFFDLSFCFNSTLQGRMLIGNSKVLDLNVWSLSLTSIFKAATAGAQLLYCFLYSLIMHMHIRLKDRMLTNVLCNFRDLSLFFASVWKPNFTKLFTL